MQKCPNLEGCTSVGAALYPLQAAAHIDDLLTVTTEVLGATGARLTLRQAIWRDGRKLTGAEVVVVAIDASGRATRLPRDVLAIARAAESART